MKTTPGTIDLPAAYAALRGKKILVTGAAGFIGGALFRRLIGYGLDVTGTVLFPREAEAIRDAGAHAQVLDLLSDESWDALLDGIDVVFHIAAMFQETEFGRAAYDKANHLGALKLAETAARAGVARFVHCSTVGVLGHVKEIPATEETPFNPMDVYHETKLAGELAILEFAKTLPLDGMVVTANRPAMVYGPGDTRMLKFYKAILSQRFVMIGSGETLAHLGYIEDQVDSFLLCAVAPRENVHGQAFNIASGEPVTLNEWASCIADIGEVELSKLRLPVSLVWSAALVCETLWKPFRARPPLFRRRVGFFTHNRAFDLTKAKRLLGYESKWDLQAGVSSALAWYKKAGHL